MIIWVGICGSSSGPPDPADKDYFLDYRVAIREASETLPEGWGIADRRWQKSSSPGLRAVSMTVASPWWQPGTFRQNTHKYLA